MLNEIPLAVFADGRTVFEEAETAAAARPWTAHPRFAGVRMKTLVAAAETAGAYSCHLVQVEPGHALDSHVHEAQDELHEVLGGAGEVTLGGRTAAYRAGTLGVIPRRTAHAVRAGDGGLVLLATFVPGLG
jgi:quercetin dioxygenase-like cupin family protein